MIPRIEIHIRFSQLLEKDLVIKVIFLVSVEILVLLFTYFLVS